MTQRCALLITVQKAAPTDANIIHDDNEKLRHI